MMITYFKDAFQAMFPESSIALFLMARQWMSDVHPPVVTISEDALMAINKPQSLHSIIRWHALRKQGIKQIGLRRLLQLRSFFFSLLVLPRSCRGCTRVSSFWEHLEDDTEKWFFFIFLLSFAPVVEIDHRVWSFGVVIRRGRGSFFKDAFFFFYSLGIALCDIPFWKVIGE